MFSWIAKGFEIIIDVLKGSLGFINPFNDNFILKDVLEFLASVIDFMNPLSDDFLLKGVLDFLSYINPFSEHFILRDVLDFLDNIIGFLNPFSDKFLGKKIVELLGDLLKALFVPSDEAVNGLVDNVKGHFRFIDTITGTADLVQDMFDNTSELPKLTLTLDNNKWYSGQITVIDLSWYAPYKKYGDLVISAFIYVFFFWRIFIHLPSIINGSGGAVDIIVKESNRKAD